MIFLLDTNAFSDLMRKHHQLEARLATLAPGDRVVICPIVRGRFVSASGSLKRVAGVKPWIVKQLHYSPPLLVNRYRKPLVIFTQQPRSLARAKDLGLMKTISG
jgi:hypothetical protein